MIAAESSEESALSADTSSTRPKRAPSSVPKPPRHKPLPPMTTAKRKPVSTPKIELPPGFAPISSRIVIHTATGIAVELPKRRLADPVTSYFIGRNNSVAIELYKTHRLAYYFITKGDFHPTNWVYMSDKKMVDELSRLVTVVDLKLCSECFLVCWENRERRHGCKDNTYFKCHGFAARADMTSLGHMIITDLPELEDTQKESVEMLIAEQKMILEMPTVEVKKEEEKWKEMLKEEWKKVIDQRRDAAKEQYQEKKRKAEKIYASGEDTEEDELVRDQPPPPKTLRLITKRNRAQEVGTSHPSAENTEPLESFNHTESPSLEELNTSLKLFITMIVSSIQSDITSDITSTVDEYLADPHIATTLLPYILLDTITDDLWSSVPSISKTLRFRLDAKNMKYTVYDETTPWKLSITLRNSRGGKGWSTSVSLEGQTKSEYVKDGLSFDSVCQALMLFRALVYTLFSGINESKTLPGIDTTSRLITSAFESMPCQAEDSVRVIKQKVCSHISR